MNTPANKQQLTFLYILSFAILIALLALVTYLTVQHGKLSDQLFYLVLVVTGLASIVLSKIFVKDFTTLTTYPIQVFPNNITPIYYHATLSKCKRLHQRN